jgi:hypothetical protein
MPEVTPTKHITQAGWDDVPHLSEQTKRELRASIEPHLLAARTEGVPSLGAGAIYPIPLEQILVDPFEIPAYWPRCYGLDVGWNRTAAVWGAHDTDADIIYLYTEHYRAHAEPSSHVSAIKARGEWMPGVIDPASRGGSQRDGRQLIMEYQSLGLNLMPAMNAVASGIQATWDRLATGRLLVFRSLGNWKAEYRLYRRNNDGLVIKENDHLMDATRYLIISGRQYQKTKPVDNFAVTPVSAGHLTTAGY